MRVFPVLLDLLALSSLSDREAPGDSTALSELQIGAVNRRLVRESVSPMILSILDDKAFPWRQPCRAGDVFPVAAPISAD
jgi:hypothetical protein